jgi:hypothetical protein
MMRLAAALALAAAVASVAVATAAPRARRVTGTVERAIHAQGPCRGGVRVTNEEMEAWAAKTQRFPLAKSTFTVFAGQGHVGKPVTRFKTDGAGRFEVRLPEGVFCVMAGELAEKAEAAVDIGKVPAAPTSQHVDADCLRERAFACDAQLYVRKEDARDVKLTLDTFTPCPQQWAQPCYRGPMPP